MKVIEFAFTLIALVLVAGLNIANHTKKPLQNHLKQLMHGQEKKRKRKNIVTEEPTVSYGYTAKRQRRQWRSPQNQER